VRSGSCFDVQARFGRLLALGGRCRRGRIGAAQLSTPGQTS